jgi:hypothetical protein
MLLENKGYAHVFIAAESWREMLCCYNNKPLAKRCTPFLYIHPENDK